MNIEEQFPSNYAKSNIDKIMSSFDKFRTNRPTNPICILAPAGFGKTHILRYLTFNTKYRRRHLRLSRIEFIYTDIHEVLIEKATGNTTVIWLKDYSPGAIAFEKILYRKILHKYQRLKKLKRNSVEIDNDKWSKDKLVSAIDNLIEDFPHKQFYFILDDTEEFFSEDTKAISNLLKFIRDRYRGKIEFIFSMDSSKWFKKIKQKTHGEIANFIAQKVVILSLMNIRETELSESFIPRKLKYLSPSYKNKINKIQNLSGGYLPFKKYLTSSLNSFENVSLDPALRNISEKLISSLTKHQENLLRKVANGEMIKGGWDTNFLIETGLLRLKDRNVSLFSPIIKNYLLNEK